MSGISAIILKSASRCNLRCSYCYVYNHEDRSYERRPKYVPDDVYEAALLRMQEHCDRRPGHTMSIIYHGGEPMLMEPARFGRLAARARAVLGPRLRRLSMQTNATLVTDAWIDVLQAHDVSVAVSLDGPQPVHDLVRVDHVGRGSYAATMRGIDRLRRRGIPPRVLTVINPGQPGLEVYRHFRREGIDWMTFLLPDVSHDNKQRWYGRYGPTPIADYLIPIFDEWFAEDDPRVVVGTFWDLLQRLRGGPGISDCFGNPLMGYLIVEADGAIEALDALRVCRDGMPASGLNVREHGFDDLDQGLPLVHQAVTRGFPLPRACEGCRHARVCGGGYLPHRYSHARQFDNPSVWCADILALLDHMQETIERHVAA